jgi:hypothetical protein
MGQRDTPRVPGRYSDGSLKATQVGRHLVQVVALRPIWCAGRGMERLVLRINSLPYGRARVKDGVRYQCAQTLARDVAVEQLLGC